jgi:hypothetical protein
MQTADIKDDMRSVLWQVVEDCIGRGPGYAQQGVVLRQAANQLGISGDTRKEQVLLNLWHDLFRNGDLVWGLNVDNPGPPWFHLPNG